MRYLVKEDLKVVDHVVEDFLQAGRGGGRIEEVRQKSPAFLWPTGQL